MTTFLRSLQEQFNHTTTENGALAHKSSFDPVVDYFGLAGAMRNRAEASADLFETAFRSDVQAAIRTLFYLRDVRGGQGERDVFRAGLKRLVGLSPVKAGRVLQHVPFYGRWDDLLIEGVFQHPEVQKIILNQWTADVAAYERGEGVSLMAKWLPSDKAANKELAIAVRKSLGLSQREYRQTLSALRSRIGLLESSMSRNDWDIDYGKLPAQAHRKHVKAFRRHAEGEYQAYLDAVERGEAKINTSTLYPHELYDMATRYGGDRKAADVMWNNLPDYTRGAEAIVMADVSGSMHQSWSQGANPIAVSVSLALYFAERNQGDYAGYFMTFASTPALMKVPSGDLSARLSAIENSTGWMGSTDVGKAFDAILAAGVKSGTVPATLYIISDMQFDQAIDDGNDTTFQTAKRKFAAAGLELPHVVFWNVDARNDQLPATILDGQVTLVSGFSPTVFGMAVEGKTPRELVDSVINGERYERINPF
ncbi:Ro-like RNA binding protein [Mycobacterium phage DuncansLeg]|nr:Ro-like RNA binding protein [Mycobacterium phage DuncansLeg]